MRSKIWLAFIAIVALIACPGSLDPKLFPDDGGEGGGSGTGGGTGGGTGTGGGGSSDSGCDIEGVLFPMTCTMGGSAACHVPGNVVADGLDLQTPNQKSRLGGVSTACNGLKMKSYMLTKVQSPNPPCGSQMPLGGPFLDSATIQCLSDYLATVDGGP